MYRLPRANRHTTRRAQTTRRVPLAVSCQQEPSGIASPAVTFPNIFTIPEYLQESQFIQFPQYLHVSEHLQGSEHLPKVPICSFYLLFPSFRISLSFQSSWRFRTCFCGSEYLLACSISPTTGDRGLVGEVPIPTRSSGRG